MHWSGTEAASILFSSFSLSGTYIGSRIRERSSVAEPRQRVAMRLPPISKSPRTNPRAGSRSPEHT